MALAEEFFQDEIRPSTTSSVDGAISVIAMSVDSLSRDHIHTLLSILPEREGSAPESAYDFSRELSEQMQLVKALRRSVLNPNGTFNSNTTARETKEAVTAATSLMQTIIRHQNNMQNFERQSAMEQAVIIAMREAPEDIRNLFFETLEKELAVIA